MQSHTHTHTAPCPPHQRANADSDITEIHYERTQTPTRRDIASTRRKAAHTHKTHRCRFAFVCFVTGQQHDTVCFARNDNRKCKYFFGNSICQVRLDAVVAVALGIRSNFNNSKKIVLHCCLCSFRRHFFLYAEAASSIRITRPNQKKPQNERGKCEKMFARIAR